MQNFQIYPVPKVSLVRDRPAQTILENFFFSKLCVTRFRGPWTKSRRLAAARAAPAGNAER